MTSNSESAATEFKKLPEFDFASARRDMRRNHSAARNAAAVIPIVFMATAQPASGQPTKVSVFEPITTHTQLLNGELSDKLKSRIADLTEAGEEEGIYVNHKAVESLFEFVERYEVGNRPQLTLRDDGSIRALFTCKHAELSVVFDGHREVKAALVAARSNGSVAKWAGVDTFNGIVDLLHGYKIAGALLG